VRTTFDIYNFIEPEIIGSNKYQRHKQDSQKSLAAINPNGLIRIAKNHWQQ
jgi:hypothetical protein